MYDSGRDNIQADALPRNLESLENDGDTSEVVSLVTRVEVG